MNNLHKLYICLFLSIIFAFTNIVSHAENNIPSISAESGIVYSLNTKQILYEKNIHDKHYPASITKVLTALIALEKNKDLEEIITYSKDAVNIEPGSSHLWVVADEQISIKNSLYGLLMFSANEMANGLAEKTSGNIPDFVKLMNEKAKQLGCNDSNFVTTNGLHDENHYTTAYDMALIAAEAYKNETFRQIINTKIYTIPPTNKNVDRVIANSHKMLQNTQWHKDYVIGGKTGYTDQAGHTLITFAEKDGLQLVAVEMKSDTANSYLDTIKMLDYAFDNYKLINVVTKDQALKNIPVYEFGKVKDNVSAQSSKSLEYVVSKDYNQKTLEVKLDLPVKFTESVIAGKKIGTANYYYNDKAVASTDLIASKNIKVSKSIFDTPFLKGIINFIGAVLSFIIYTVLFLIFVLAVLIAIAKIFKFKIKVKRKRPRR